MPDAAPLSPEDLAQQLANAPDAPASDRDPGPAPDRDPDTADDGRRARIFTPSGHEVRDCPVVPLGVRGAKAYFLDANGQLRDFAKLDLQALQSLFAGRMAAICDAWPKFTASADGPKRKKGHFEQADASLSLWEACGRLGVFNPANSVRGVGAWADDDGALVYHLGDRVLHDGREIPPGRIGGRIYPAASPIPGPLATGPDPVPDILETLTSWNWALPDLHPFVALGMIGCQMFGGALRWRPAFWMTAAQGAGKSTFQDLLKHMQGDGLIQSQDATKSGITSILGQSSLPVALDEFEPDDERSTRSKDIVTMVRVAASGGEWARGSADQSAVGGKLYSSFFFTSILIPGWLQTQDVQRLIRLDLQPLKTGKGLSLVPKTWRARGARLKAQLIRRWPTLQARVTIYRRALELEGVLGRIADNWEIVLAMADMAQAEDLPDDATAQGWARKVALLVKADVQDVQNDADAMLSHLLGMPLDPFRRGEQYTVAQWIMVAAGLPAAPAQLLPVSFDGPAGLEDRKERASEQLGQYGLKVVRDDQGEPCLAIANTGPQRQRALFERTKWADGAWQQSAKRVPNARVAPNTRSFGGKPSRHVLVPLASIPGLAMFPDTRTRAAPGNDEIDDYGSDWR